VGAANFLLDSESRMKAVSAASSNAETDPVVRMEVDQKRATDGDGSRSTAGKTYYFCADDCKKKFDAEPAKVCRRGARPTIRRAGDEGPDGADARHGEIHRPAEERAPEWRRAATVRTSCAAWTSIRRRPPAGLRATTQDLLLLRRGLQEGSRRGTREVAGKQ